MIDGAKHTVHMTKRGNYFNTAVIHNGKEIPLDDLQITARFERKKEILNRKCNDPHGQLHRNS